MHNETNISHASITAQFLMKQQMTKMTKMTKMKKIKKYIQIYKTELNFNF